MNKTKGEFKQIAKRVVDAILNVHPGAGTCIAVGTPRVHAVAINRSLLRRRSALRRGGFGPTEAALALIAPCAQLLKKKILERILCPCWTK